jgi:hypothetical protein
MALYGHVNEVMCEKAEMINDPIWEAQYLLQRAIDLMNMARQLKEETQIPIYRAAAGVAVEKARALLSVLEAEERGAHD